MKIDTLKRAQELMNAVSEASHHVEVVERDGHDGDGLPGLRHYVTGSMPLNIFTMEMQTKAVEAVRAALLPELRQKLADAQRAFDEFREEPSAQPPPLLDALTLRDAFAGDADAQERLRRLLLDTVPAAGTEGA